MILAKPIEFANDLKYFENKKILNIATFLKNIKYEAAFMQLLWYSNISDL
jgi:hypothetical protein